MQLPVFSSGAAALLSANGDPVWPVASERQRARLANLARLHGAGLAEAVEAREIEGGGQADATGTLVRYLDDESFRPARLYAHLTGRSVAPARDAADLCRPETAVVFSTAHRLAEAHLDAMYVQRDPGVPAPGLIVHNDEQHLLDAALVFSAARHLACSGVAMSRLSIVIDPIVPGGVTRLPQAQVLGGDSPLAELRRAIGRGAWLLTLSGHCDGIDVQMSQTAVLCPLKGASWHVTATPPRCIENQYCHRSRVGVTEALASLNTFDASAIAARVLFLDTCTGFLLGNTLVASEYSLMLRLISNARFGCAIASWYNVLRDPAFAAELSAHLMAGKRVGNVVALMNGGEAGGKLWRKVMLVGDPDYILQLAG